MIHKKEAANMTMSTPIALKISLLAVYIALTVFRAPTLLYPGRLWAEEGAIYFRVAYMPGTSLPLVPPEAGYFNFVSTGASLLAARFIALEYVPVFTGLIALLFQTIPPLLLLFSKMTGLDSLRLRSVALFVLLFTQPSENLWITTIHSQFFLCAATGVILISESPNRSWHMIRLVVLLIAGLTGVVSCLLVPFFVGSYLWTRKPDRLQETIALTLSCLIQAGLVLTGPLRQTHALWTILPCALFVKQWVLPLGGVHLATKVSEIIRDHGIYTRALPALLTLAPFAMFFVCLARWGQKQAMILFCSAVLLAVVSFLKSTESQDSIQELILCHISAEWAGWYYYAPNVMLALALLMSPRNASARGQSAYRLVSAAVVGLMLTVGAIDFFANRNPVFFTGPSWRSEVAAWRRDPNHAIRIWPHPWTLDLKRSNKS